MEYILETSGLTKIYGKTKVVNHIDAHIKQGDIYGLIGRNGAGKTTFLKMISGLAIPSEGDFTLFGSNGKERTALMNRIGVLVEAPGVYPKLSALENLKIKCIAMGVREKETPKQILKTVGLDNVGKKAVGKFSLGMKQRLGIGLAMVGNPDIIILDEPINGLDPRGIAEVRETIEKLNKEQGITFIISSHILEELSKIATSYGIIHNGTLLQELTREELMKKCSNRIELKTNDITQTCTVLEDMNITDYKVVDHDVIHIFQNLQDVGEITLELAKHQIKTLGISVKNESLEDYYFNITGGKIDD